MKDVDTLVHIRGFKEGMTEACGFATQTWARLLYEADNLGKLPAPICSLIMDDSVEAGISRMRRESR